MYSFSLTGGLATLVASFLARSRSSNEPDLSITRVKDLENFIRECEAFILDNGHITSPTDKVEAKLIWFRERFEGLLGKTSGSVNCLHPRASSLLTLARPGKVSRPRRLSVAPSSSPSFSISSTPANHGCFQALQVVIGATIEGTFATERCIATCSVIRIC